MFLNCMSIMKNLKYQNGCQNWDFSHPDCILVGIQDFQAKLGESQQNQDGWTVFQLVLNRKTKGLITTCFHCQRNFALSKFCVANFSGCEFSLWWNFMCANFCPNKISVKQNFTFNYSGCEISPRWQRNFSWLNENSQVLTKFCRIFARAKLGQNPANFAFISVAQYCKYCAPQTLFKHQC